jgi:AcrR family transcriptional regulator
MPTSTYERIREATIEIIRQSGPVDFRIEELVNATGQSVGGIYHHFGNRDGLLAAAYEKMVGDLLDSDRATILTLLEECSSLQEFQAGLHEFAVSLQSPERTEMRWLRLEGMVLARRKPVLWEALHKVHLRHADAFEVFVIEAQDRGWLRQDLSPYHVYLAMTSVAVGTMSDNIGRNALDADEWASAILNLFTDRMLVAS